MNPDTTPTPRTDEARQKAFSNQNADYLGYVYMANHAEKLERELTEKTNDVARLRGILRDQSNWMRRNGLIHQSEQLGKKLAPAPEEPCHICKGEENARLFCSRCAPEEPVTHPLMDCQVCGEFRGHGHECKIPAPEWRELGPDEERVQGEFSSQNPPMFEKCKVCGEEYGFHSGGKWDAFCRRTKRPLPVREDKCPHHSIVPLEQGDMIVHQCTRCGKKLKKYPKPQEEMPLEKAPDDLHAWMRLQEEINKVQEEINKEVAGELQKLRDEIELLKKASVPLPVPPRPLGIPGR